jgi:acetyl esterase/lipase
MTNAPAPVHLLDPEVAAAVAAFAMPVLSDEVVVALRGATAPPPPLSDVVERTDRMVPGDPPVRVRVHRAKDAEGALPCVLSIHGGGYVFGSCEMDDPAFDRWCPTLGVVGVSVDYRLAPETPYPGPIEDCYAALRWTFAHAEELGIDPSRIGVRGVSAGGGLAAALALLVQQRGELQLAFQLLDCPMIDDRQVTASSRLDGLPMWSHEANTYGWRSYLGALHGTDDVPCTAAPARATAEDLAGLPPAFVSVGAIDGFLDEDVDYALRLNHAGVPTELHVYPHGCHGYQAAPASAVARQSAADQEAWLRRVLA